MLTSLSTAVSGLDCFQQDMDVIGNNIANINTNGFKAGVVNLADSFSDTLQSAVSPVQIGTGVYDQAITSNWTQGAVNNTGVNTDLAISGNGFFVVQDPTSGTPVRHPGRQFFHQQQRLPRHRRRPAGARLQRRRPLHHRLHQD